MKKQKKVSIASYSAIPRESYRLATARSTASACCHSFRMVAAATGNWLRWGRISIFSVRVQFGSYMNYKTIFELITRIVNPIFDQFTLPCSDNIRKRPNLIKQKRLVSPEGYERMTIILKSPKMPIFLTKTSAPCSRPPEPEITQKYFWNKGLGLSSNLISASYE